jgi:MFS transporter, FSR family, fosmidomycin resistance protein
MLDPARARPVEEVEQSTSAKRERVALATTSGAHFLHDGIADSLYVLLPIWAQTFGLNYTQVGGLRTSYSAVMAAFQMPAGILAERHGERALLVGGTLVAGAAFAAMSMASGFIGVLLAILLAGLGSAVQHPLASAIISQAYPAERRRSALGVYNFAGDVGKMVVAFGVSAAAGIIGWRATVAGYGTLVAISSAILLLVLWRSALGSAGPSSAQAGAQNTILPESKGLQLTNPRGFVLLSCIHGIDSAGRTGALTLLPFVLVQKGSSIATVGFALACIFAGGAIGKLACGLLADRIGILRTVVVTELGTVAILLVTLFTPLPVILAMMPLLGIALNGTSSVLYGTVTDFVRPDRQARAFGLFYTIGSAAGGAAPIVFGAVSDWVGLTYAILGLTAIVLAILPLTGLLRPHVPAG